MLIGIGFFGIESFPLILFSCPYFSNPFIPLLPKNNQTLISNLGVMWNEMKLVIIEHQMSLNVIVDKYTKKKETTLSYEL